MTLPECFRLPYIYGHEEVKVKNSSALEVVFVTVFGTMRHAG